MLPHAGWCTSQGGERGRSEASDEIEAARDGGKRGTANRAAGYGCEACGLGAHRGRSHDVKSMREATGGADEEPKRLDWQKAGKGPMKAPGRRVANNAKDTRAPMKTPA